MLPLAIDTVLFQLGPFHIYAYGFMLSVGYGAGIILALREARRRDFPVNLVLDYLVSVFIAGLLTARFFFVLTELPYFLAFPEDLLNIGNGLSPFGAVLGFGLVTFWYIHQYRWDYRVLADILAAPLALGLAITSVGTSCLGRMTSVPWGIHWDGDIYHPLGAYQAVGSYITFILVWSLRRKARFPGQMGLVALFFLGLTQLVTGFFAAETLFFNSRQLQGLLAVVLALVMVRGKKITAADQDYMEHYRALGPSKAPWYRRMVSWLWGLLLLLVVYFWRARSI
ncbi:MAG TPA: hypothetical protein GXX47_07010 [Firmicutes bacterium]|nr:hypothetical protein [Bacillota bacterium]